MKNRFYFLLTSCLVLLLGISFSVPAKSADEGRGGFTEADGEYYLPEELFFFVRPGLDFELVSIEIPGDRQPLATFTVKDPGGYPLDMDGVSTPGEIEVRWMLSHIPAGEENRINYHSGFRDSDGTYTALGDGMYTYKFGTVLPEDYDADTTHVLAVSARRNFSEEFVNVGIQSRYVDNYVENFVPSGAAEPMPRDIVTTDTCNRCHGQLAIHGGGYTEVEVCQHCHRNSWSIGETLRKRFST